MKFDRKIFFSILLAIGIMTFSILFFIFSSYFTDKIFGYLDETTENFSLDLKSDLTEKQSKNSVFQNKSIDINSKFESMLHLKLNKTIGNDIKTDSCLPSGFSYTSVQNIHTKLEPRLMNCVSNDAEIQLLNQDFLISCPLNSGKILVENNTNSKYEYFPKWVPFDKQLKLPYGGSEFFIVSCGTRHEQAVIDSNFNTDWLEKNSKKNQRPLSVYYFMLSEVSRVHFYRSLVSTVTFLNKILSSSAFSSYDFYYNSAQGYSKNSNLVPLLFGKTSEDFSKIFSQFNMLFKEHQEFFDEKIEKLSVIEHYKSLGFVTMVGFDSEFYGFGKEIKYYLNADHVFYKFWKATYRVFGYFDYMLRERCVGNKNFQRFLLDYTSLFIRKYQNYNKFVYNHFSLVHEQQENVLASVDNDLHTFLQDFFGNFHPDQEDFVMIFASDYGKSIENFSLEGEIEKKNPVSILITNKNFVSRKNQSIHKNLEQNSERLIGKLDWYTSLIDLAYFSSENIGKQIEKYEKKLENPELESSYSIFSDKIPENRDCSELKNKNPSCLCDKPKVVPLNSDFVKIGVYKAIEKTFNHLNSVYIDGKICKKLLINEIMQVKEYQVKSVEEGGNRILTALVSIIDEKKTEIEISLYSAQINEFKFIQGSEASLLPVYSFLADINDLDMHMSIQVTSMKFIDSSICDSPANSKFNFDICLCVSKNF